MTQYIKTMTDRELVTFTHERFQDADEETKRFIATTINTISEMEQFLEDEGLLNKYMDLIQEKEEDIH